MRPALATLWGSQKRNQKVFSVDHIGLNFVCGKKVPCSLCVHMCVLFSVPVLGWLWAVEEFVPFIRSYQISTLK